MDLPPIDVPSNRALRTPGAPCWFRTTCNASRAGALFLTGSLFLQAAHAAEDPADLSEIVVTGSRIPNQLANSLVPVTVLSRADLERGNRQSLGEILQALPFNTGSPANTNVDNGGDGAERIDLRGLGPQRTLVLLNGRRMMNGGIGADSAVDLTSIPVAMIERVEVLTSDATAIYGADAVGGVVNLITREHFRGFEASGSESRTSRRDGGITRAQLLAGVPVFGEGDLQIGLDYLKQRSVNPDRRAYSATPQKYVFAGEPPQYFGSPTTPYGLIRVPDGNVLGLDPRAYRILPGASGNSASDYAPFTIDDTWNYLPYTYSQTPSERSSLWLQGSLPLAGETTLFVEGLGSWRKSSQRLAPSPYSASVEGASLLADGSMGIPANSYYNPFGVDLFDVRRRFVEIDNRGFTEDVHLWRAVAGLRGSVQGWHWETYAGYSQSHARTREDGLVSLGRLINGIGPSGLDASGRVVCGVPGADGIVPAANIIAGCVPVDLFHGPGSITPEQVNYLTTPLLDRGSNSQLLLNANLEGEWGSIGGRPIQWSTGLSYRRETGRYAYDPVRAGGVVGELQQNIPGGSFNTKEAYAETRMTLLHDLPAVQALDLSAGVRYSDFSTFGGHAAWQSGLRWQPLRHVSFRASFATGYRAPSIAELYQTQTLSLASYDDPCGNDPDPAVRANCAAHGVPGGSYVQDFLTGYAALSGGNTRLDPERSRSFNAGMDLRWDGGVPGNAGIGFFRTQIKGFVSGPDIVELMSQCEVDNVQAACDQITRNADGSLNRIVATLQNYGRVSVRGLDFTLNARTETAAGRFQGGLLATYLMRRDNQLFEGSALSNDAGRLSVVSNAAYAYPHWRGMAHLDWQRGPWRAAYALQIIGGFTETTGFVLDGGSTTNPVGKVVYHDLEGGYEFASGVALRLGVSNLTDEDPPFVNQATGPNTDAATYRLLGRTFFAQLRFSLR
jgi:iron complex outermembrane recepter protein